jgi:hypothetical protein
MKQERQLPTIYLLLATTTFGCAAGKLAPMDPSARIDTQEGYRQDGKLLDRESMLTELAQEPEAKPDVDKAKALATISLVLSGVGGALVGWQLGAWAGGADVDWRIAAAGGATIAVALPLAFWSDSSVGAAVESHNRNLPSPAVPKATDSDSAACIPCLVPLPARKRPSSRL